MRTYPKRWYKPWPPSRDFSPNESSSTVKALLAGAILAPGKCTVSPALRAVGLDQHKRYHRLLSRAVWSGREASRVTS